MTPRLVLRCTRFGSAPGPIGNAGSAVGKPKSIGAFRRAPFFRATAPLYIQAMNAHARPAVQPLVDPFGRAIAYVRVSVTDRCDYRCVYCMSEDMNFLPKRDVLSLEELDRLCSAFVGLGARKIRITGGEPLVRRNVMSLFHGLSRHLAAGALDEVTLTTNGSQLARFAA